MKEWLQVVFNSLDKWTKFAKESIEIGHQPNIDNASSQ
jgi:hypothetical protein